MRRSEPSRAEPNTLSRPKYSPAPARTGPGPPACGWRRCATLGLLAFPSKAKDQKGGSYAHQAQKGFSGAWNPSGLAPDAEKALVDRGLIAKPAAKANSRKRSTSATSAARPVATSPRDLEAELPSRSKGKRPLKSRHFRLPQEIDEKLEFLADHHDSTLVYVVCKAVQEEWLRVMRQQRRDERTTAGVSTDPETGDDT